MNSSDTPLDRTTARVVSELASRIVPELTQALNASEAERRLTLTNSLVAAFDELSALKSICEGLARSIEASKSETSPSRSAVPSGINEALSRIEAKFERLARDNAEETQAGRQVLLQPLGAVVEELSALRAQAGPLAEAGKGLRGHDEALLKLQDAVNRLREACQDVISRQAGLSKEFSALEEQMKPKAQAPGPAPASPGGALPGQEGKVAQLLQVALPNWEGVLKAHAQAQTRELDSLSQELGNLQRQTHATLLQSLQDMIAQELTERDAEWEDRLRTERAALERGLAPFRRVLWLLAGLGLTSLIFSVARFVMTP